VRTAGLLLLFAACGRIGFDTNDEGVRDEAVAAAYGETVLGDGPIAYFRFNEASGPDAVSEVGGFTGTYVGDFEYGAIGAAGDSTVVFDGLSTWVELGDVFRFAGATPYTIEAWVFPYSIEDHTLFIVDRDTPSGDTGYHLYVGETYTILSREDADFEFSFASRDTPPPLNRWSHVVGIFDGTVSYLYINGVEVGNAMGPGSGMPLGDSAGSFSIGDSASPQFFKWNGRIDEVAIYGSALPLERIRAHYRLARQ
jgi:hypothetical protein